MSILQMRKLRHTHGEKAKGKQQERMDSLGFEARCPGFTSLPVQHLTPCVVGGKLWVLLNKTLLCSKREECGSPHCLWLRTVLTMGIITALHDQHCLLGERFAKGNEATLPKPLSGWKKAGNQKGDQRGAEVLNKSRGDSGAMLDSSGEWSRGLRSQRPALPAFSPRS